MKTETIQKSVILEAQYACFNRRRTLRSLSEGEPSLREESGLLRVMDPSAPENTYVNRLIVLQPIDRIALLSAIKNHDQQKLSLSVDILPHTLRPDLSSMLVEEKFVPVRELIVLQRNLTCSAEEKQSGISIRKIGPGEGTLFLNAVMASIGQEVAPEIVAAKQHFYESTSFVCYLASVDEQLAGLATLYLAGDQAWLANAFTFEPFRKLGVQSALIQRRIQDAAALGVRALFTDVEFMSASYHNLRRLGFDFHYAITSWERPET
ncbi:GNAT family N-acetyltransferase [Oligoflexus tunisiensis]|uniref:GNAT family N-acetyltransferase n=1 Tax=Oligoflexus tunisiensis TaxID=708132 RepID=UPI00114CD00A|nr:GNAT family N-acetyltransferase [Oligoflexus tunisiensis]